METEALLSVAFLAGFFGSGHCFGMCGPLVVLMETSGGQPQTWSRRFLYNAGRASFYILLGAAAGSFGLVLTKVAGVDAGLRVLRIIAAALVIAMGVDMVFGLRLLGWLERAGTSLWQRLRPLTKTLLPISSPGKAFGAGFLWGALPCGLVYSSVSLAAASGSIAKGSLVMFVFWLGTLPALLAAGASARELAGWARRPAFRRIAGGLMIVVGVIALTMPMLMTVMMGKGGMSS